jgi:hypothetical protein
VDIRENPDDNNAIIESVADSSIAVAAQPSAISNLQFSNVVSGQDIRAKNAILNQQMIGQLSISIAGKTIQKIQADDPLLMKSAQEVLTGNTLSEPIASVKAPIVGPPLPPDVVPIKTVMPNPIPAGVDVYVEIPLYLAYDNEDGTENFTYTIKDVPEKK